MTLSRARALADRPMALCFATGAEIAEAVDRLASSTIATGPRDAARLAILKAAITEPRQ